MFAEHLFHFPYPWRLISALGSAPVALSLAVAAILMQMRHPEARPRALRWAAVLALAVLVTLASKVAFLGWGLGSAEFNFTGVSGHAMFAAAVYPVLLPTLASGAQPSTRRFALAAGCAVAILIGMSRLVLGAHSASEVVAGWLVGGAASIAVLGVGTQEQFRFNAKALVALGLWLVLVAATAPQLNTQAVVTRVALKLSGRDHPYKRSGMLRDLRRRQGASVTGLWEARQQQPAPSHALPLE